MSNDKHTKTKLFLIEDNDFTRSVIRSLLQQVDEFQVVGESSDGEDGIEKVIQLEPKIVIADIGLPGCDGVETIKRIKSENPKIQAVMLTAHDSDHDFFRSFEAGAQAYLLKMNMTRERLELAIKSVEEGSVWLDPLMAQRMLSAALQQLVATGPSPLSEGEKSVLSNIASHTPTCNDGVCSVDPTFLENLTRFSKAADEVV